MLPIIAVSGTPPVVRAAPVEDVTCSISALASNAAAQLNSTGRSNTLGFVIALNQSPKVLQITDSTNHFIQTQLIAESPQTYNLAGYFTSSGTDSITVSVLGQASNVLTICSIPIVVAPASVAQAAPAPAQSCWRLPNGRCFHF